MRWMDEKAHFVVQSMSHELLRVGNDDMVMKQSNVLHLH